VELISKIYDNRINAVNILFEMSIEEYYLLSTEILTKNKFQRRRVKSSSTVYSLLKEDLVVGCIIPPIVLAISDKEFKDNSNLKEERYNEYIQEKQDKLIILDGLQRTFTIRDLYKELNDSEDSSRLENLKNQKLRIEIYFGMSKTDILYRMLTLNTGQTPMSMRHQIEILYSDYLEKDLDGVLLLMESDEKSPSNPSEYKFKDIVEGFNSYLDRDYLPMDRSTVLENIKSLDKLSSESKNHKDDLFLSYLKAFDKFINILSCKSSGWIFDDNTLEAELSTSPFGKDIIGLFRKPQVMTGFGSAIGKLIDFNAFGSIDDVLVLIDDINLSETEDNAIGVNNGFNNYITKLDLIRKTATKIGNDQRLFFHYLFRELFDKKGDAYLNFNRSVDEAYSMYIRKTQ